MEIIMITWTHLRTVWILDYVFWGETAYLEGRGKFDAFHSKRISTILSFSLSASSFSLSPLWFGHIPIEIETTSYWNWNY